MKMWETLLKGELKQDETSYKHLITSVFQYEALPFNGYSAPRAPRDFVLVERKSHTALSNLIVDCAERNTRDEPLDIGKSTHGFIVMGPPDIGKSACLNLVFLRCAAIKEVGEGSGKRGKPVIVCDRSVSEGDRRYLIFTPGPDPKVEISSFRPAVLDDHRTIYLRYFSPRVGSSAGEMQVCRAFTVATSRPNKDIFEAAEKGNMGVLYTYRWEPEEAEDVQKALGLQADPKAVSLCGFSPRLLMYSPESVTIAAKQVKDAIDSVIDIFSMMKFADGAKQRGGLYSWSSNLMSMKPREGCDMFRDFDVCAVSDHVRTEMKSKAAKFTG